MRTLSVSRSAWTLDFLSRAIIHPERAEQSIFIDYGESTFSPPHIYTHTHRRPLTYSIKRI